MKKIISFFLLAVCIAFFSSCAAKNAEQPISDNNLNLFEEPAPTPTVGGVLRLSMHDVDTLNPLATKSAANYEILSLCYDGLFKLGADLYPENQLCESYILSDDGLTLTLNIKSGVSFHDGSVVSADDVAFSILFARDSGGVLSQSLARITDVAVLANSVKITLSSPEFNFISKLTFPILKSDAAALGADFLPVGTGIFKLTEYEMSKTLYFTACENHFSGKMPYIRDVRVDIVKDKAATLSMFENSLTDVLLPDISDEDIASSQRNCREANKTYGNFIFLGVNNQHPILLDSNLKRVISDSVNRDALVSLNKTRLKKTTIPVYPTSWLYPAPPENDYLPESAKAAILSLGWSDTDSDGTLDKTIMNEKTDLVLDILVNDSQDKIRIAELIKKNLEDIGIKTSVTILPFWEYTERITNKSYDLFIGEVRFSDNQNISDFVSGNGNLFGAYFEEIYTALDEISRIGDKDALKVRFPSLCSSFSENLPLIGLYFDDDPVLINNRIKGNITPVRGNTFANICDWFIY